jgi:hypothetical protein
MLPSRMLAGAMRAGPRMAAVPGPLPMTHRFLQDAKQHAAVIPVDAFCHFNAQSWFPPWWAFA